MRIKAVHVINLPPVLKTAVNLVKSFLKPKLAARVNVLFENDGSSRLI